MAWGSEQLDATIWSKWCKRVDASQGWDDTKVLAAKVAGCKSWSETQMTLWKSWHSCSAITCSIKDKMIRAKAAVTACRIRLRMKDCVCAMFVSDTSVCGST